MEGRWCPWAWCWGGEPGWTGGDGGAVQTPPEHVGLKGCHRQQDRTEAVGSEGPAENHGVTKAALRRKNLRKALDSWCKE